MYLLHWSFAASGTCWEQNKMISSLNVVGRNQRGHTRVRTRCCGKLSTMPKQIARKANHSREAWCLEIRAKTLKQGGINVSSFVGDCWWASEYPGNPKGGQLEGYCSLWLDLSHLCRQQKDNGNESKHPLITHYTQVKSQFHDFIR